MPLQLSSEKRPMCILKQCSALLKLTQAFDCSEQARQNFDMYSYKVSSIIPIWNHTTKPLGKIAWYETLG